jgi:hypothetical protein
MEGRQGFEGSMRFQRGFGNDLERFYPPRMAMSPPVRGDMRN